MESPLRVLIVKLTAIGDVLHAMPVACALRERFPAATIGWLVEGPAGDLLVGHEAIDELFVAPRRWLRSPSAIMSLGRRLRACRFDVALDLQGLTKSALAAVLSGARRRIGFDGSLRLDLGRWFNNDLFLLTIGREASRWINNVLVRITAEHIVDRYLQMLEPLGIRSPQVRFEVPQDARAGRTIDRLLRARSLTGPLAVINPGAGKRSKLWSGERFVEVARHLGTVHRLGVMVVWAGRRERRWAERIVAAAGGCAQLAPPTTLTELAALVRRARIFVGCDTGPLHLAAAVGTPCVGMFGTMPAARNGPYGAGHVALQQAQLRGSSVRRHHAGNEAMLAITTEMVTGACDRILRP